MTPSDRQAQQDASAAVMPERDREFWEAAFCAALTGLVACPVTRDDLPPDVMATALADAALAARNARIWPNKEKD